MEHAMNRKMQKKSRNIFLIVAMLGLFIGYSPTANASKNIPSKGIGFYYQTIAPVNQQQEGNFFDLVVKPGQQQALEIELINESDEALTISVAINNATTTEKGLINYSKSKLKHTPDFTYKLTDMLKGPKEITLKEKEKRKLKLSLMVPNESIDGLILGGIELKKKTVVPTTNEATTINNEFAYVFSVALQMNEKEIAPQFSANSPVTSQASEANIVTISINNDRPTVADKLTVETIIRSNDSDKVLAEFKLKEGKMAPLSIMEIPITFDQSLPGTYRIETKLKRANQEWQWEQLFEIKAKQTEEKEVYPTPISNKKGKLFILPVIILLVTTVIFYSLFRKLQK